MSSEEVELRSMTLEGILSIQAGDNPRVVADKLLSFIPPGERAGEVDPAAAAEPAGDPAEAELAVA
jgi:chemotaxis protein MotA